MLPPEQEDVSTDPFNLPTDTPSVGIENNPDPNANAQAVLGENVEGLKKKLYEERFIFSMVIVVLFDAFFFKSMDNWGSSIAILLLEIVALLVLARRLNVSDLLVITSSIIQALRR
jgi:hypothetical protein